LFLVKLIIVVLIVFAIMTIIEIGLRKVLKIGKRDKTRPRYLNNVHKWGEIGLLIAFFFSYFVIINYYMESEWRPLWIVYFFLVMQIFRTIMEWLYAREQREYIFQLLGVFFLLAFIMLGTYTDWIDKLFGF
jgi:uncharacterized membrane protein